VTGQTVRADDARATDPRLLWRALAPAIAGRPRVRVSRDGGRTYPGRSERALTEDLPAAPAAVLLYDEHAAARCLAADFDVTRGGQHQVDTDTAAFTALIQACGGRVVADVSPTGGRHVYVFWARPLPLTELRPVLHALRARFPSLDTAPMLGATDGCIRPPGAAHRRGGHQTLITPLPEALATVAAPCGPGVWSALLDALRPELDALTVIPGPEGQQAATLTRPVGPGARLSARIERIATSGLYETERYASPSEARQAVVTAAVAAGWGLADVAARLEDGRWPGLAGMYRRYRPQARHQAVAADWRKANDWLGREKSARRSTTRGLSHSPAPPPTPEVRSEPTGATRRAPRIDEDSEYQWIRAWWNALLATERLRYTGRAGLSVRLLLRAIGAMAQRRGSRYLDVGRRSLSLACGLDDSTVSELLRVLREEADPWLVLIEGERGVHGDLYELRIPDAAIEVAAWRAWRAGRIEAIHPAFRVLGATSALVFEALTTEPARRRDITHDAALSPRTVDEALTDLAAHGLAERVPNAGWRRGPTALDTVADTLGATERVAELIAEYAVERAAWRAVLGAVAGLTPAGVLAASIATDPVDTDRVHWPDLLDEPPPEDLDTVVGVDAPEPTATELRAAVDLLAAAFGVDPLDLGPGDPATDPRYGVHGRPSAPPERRSANETA
jgi:hypothetical protein